MYDRDPCLFVCYRQRQRQSVSHFWYFHDSVCQQNRTRKRIWKEAEVRAVSCHHGTSYGARRALVIYGQSQRALGSICLHSTTRPSYNAAQLGFGHTEMVCASMSCPRTARGVPYTERTKHASLVNRLQGLTMREQSRNVAYRSDWRQYIVHDQIRLPIFSSTKRCSM